MAFPPFSCLLHSHRQILGLAAGVIFKRVKKESHGRCIDAYSLAVKVAEAQDKLKGKEYDPFMLLGDVLRWIELEPTVLEASEGRKK